MNGLRVLRVHERFREALANQLGYFWLPCDVCSHMFAGYEWGDVDGLPSSVPTYGEPGRSTGICPDCTADGFGYDYETSRPLWCLSD